MLIETTKGLMETDELRCERGEIDNENETTTWVEYWLGDELVHRSVNMVLKTPLFSEGFTATFG